MQTERDKKKAQKAAKKAEQDAAKREKELQAQKKLVEVFNNKQAKAQAEKDTIGKLKQWLQNPPYKSTNRDMKKKETFYSIMQCFQALKPEQWDSLYNAENIDINDAVALNKYITTAYEMLSSKDTKTASFVSYPLLNKAQIKLVSVFGNAITIKTAFEKGQLL